MGQDGLIDRFRSLASIAEPQSHSSPELEQDEDDDKTVEDLLAEIGHDDQWTHDLEKSNEIQKLLHEARQALSQMGEHSLSRDSVEPSQSAINSKPGPNLPSPGAPTPTSETDIEAPPAQMEDEEAALYLQQILDELQLEEHDKATKGSSCANEDGISGHTPPQDLPTVRQGSPELDMPSVPTSIPLILHQPIDDKSVPNFDLPSAPTTAPQRKLTIPSVHARMPQYSGQDIETWCVICNDDATVRCLGCEGELYCAKCWKEGHMGKEAGYDERTHRWAKYKQR